VSPAFACSQAYGLRLRPELRLSTRLAQAAPGEPDVRVRLGDVPSPSGTEEIWRTRIDDATVTVDRHADSALTIRFGDAASFRIGPRGRVVTCAPRPGADRVRWERFLLDTVLWSTAVVHGRVALHAAAVADGDGAIAVVGGTGGGKTSVALALAGRGGALVSDDVLVVSSEPHAVLAHPAPPVMNVDVAADAELRASVGRVLGTFGGEHWLHVARSAQTVVPLRAVVVLTRSSRASRAYAKGPRDALLTLEAHSVSLPGLPQLNLRTRFDVLADIAARVPVLDLRVPPSLPPDGIADIVETLPSLAREPALSPARRQPTEGVVVK
jgi:hypothetical protein